MNIKSIVKYENGLLLAITIYCAVCLYLFMSNMVFIDEHPNTSDWISTIGVTIAWIGLTCIGLVSWLLILRDKRFIGVIAIILFSVFNFGSAGHYSLEPVSSHTYISNIAIWLQVVTAWIVLIIITGFFVSHTNKNSLAVKSCIKSKTNDIRSDNAEERV